MDDNKDMTSSGWAENARLRKALGQLRAALQAYHDAPHFEIEGDELEVIVQSGVRENAATALEAAYAIIGKAR